MYEANSGLSAMQTGLTCCPRTAELGFHSRSSDTWVHLLDHCRGHWDNVHLPSIWWGLLTRLVLSFLLHHLCLSGPQGPTPAPFIALLSANLHQITSLFHPVLSCCAVTPQIRGPQTDTLFLGSKKGFVFREMIDNLLPQHRHIHANVTRP